MALPCDLMNLFSVQIESALVNCKAVDVDVMDLDCADGVAVVQSNTRVEFEQPHCRYQLLHPVSAGSVSCYRMIGCKYSLSNTPWPIVIDIVDSVDSLLYCYCVHPSLRVPDGVNDCFISVAACVICVFRHMCMSLLGT
jgi:hypothetical protein